MVGGCRLLVVGCWFLVVGCSLLVVGCWLLDVLLSLVTMEQTPSLSESLQEPMLPDCVGSSATWYDTLGSPFLVSRKRALERRSLLKALVARVRACARARVRARARGGAAARPPPPARPAPAAPARAAEEEEAEEATRARACNERFQYGRLLQSPLGETRKGQARVS